MIGRRTRPRRWILAAALVAGACDGPRSDSGSTPPDPSDSSTGATGATGDTGTGPPPPIAASCAIQPDNVLRADCTVTVDPPGPISLSFAPADGAAPARVVTDDAPVPTHTVHLWRMHGDTPYAFTAVATATGATVDGAFATPPVPIEDRPAFTVVAGGPSTATDDLMFQVECDQYPEAVVVDPSGELVWYQRLTGDLDGSHDVLGVSFTDDRTVAAVLDRGRVRSFDLDGALRVDAVVGEEPGLDRLVHHDVYGRDGLLYVLNADLAPGYGGPYVVDGVYVLDPSGAVIGSWSLASVVEVTGGGPIDHDLYWESAFPGAIDWSHANSIQVDEAGDWTLSLSHLRSIVRVDGLRSPTPGALRWILGGDPTNVLPTDFAITDPDDRTDDETFAHQHHAVPLPDGRIRMLDNGLFGPSRILELRPDEATGTAAITGAWSIGVDCAYEGAVVELDNGHLLATCAPDRTIHEVDPVTGAVVRVVRVGCALGDGDAVLARVFPVSL
ncbi:MAG: aryl-sulfate sulfotransferase [Myxococcota bacterium]